MAEEKCTEESKEALVKLPNLLDSAKIDTDVMNIIRKSSAVSLFRQEGIPLSKFKFGCAPKSGFAELKPPNPLLARLNLSFTYKDSAAFANIRCRF